MVKLWVTVKVALGVGVAVKVEVEAGVAAPGGTKFGDFGSAGLLLPLGLGSHIQEAKGKRAQRELLKTRLKRARRLRRRKEIPPSRPAPKYSSAQCFKPSPEPLF
jgi:hypothetical protein